MQSVVELFSKETEIISEKDAWFCFGMCKITIPMETKDIRKLRQIAVSSEFYEMIGRVSELKFPGNEM